MIAQADRDRADALLARFRDAGAAVLRPPILQPAGPLLDLYGEDIRARAFVTQDPLHGETMLRPDFTVPVVQHHLAAAPDSADAGTGGAGGAARRYAYAGEIFRRQEDDAARPREYLQAGFEVLGGPATDADRARTEAEVFATLAGILPSDARAATGDLGLLLAAIDGLDTTARRRAALRRHVWRPGRFRALMRRFDGTDPRAPLAPPSDAPPVGLRETAEIAARREALAEDAATPPLARAQADALAALLAWRGTLAAAVAPIRALSGDLPTLAAAADRLAARADALADRGIDPDRLAFAPAHHRTSMEYYDGMVFTLSAPGAGDGPPLATGGRYDALTAAMGAPAPVPAVGGVVRPGLLEAAR